jgi:serine/threonine protein phosphatase PrpC
MSMAYVGDSRLYLIRNNEIDQLTDDHSLVYEQLKKGVISEKEAKESQYRNIITRALGVENTVEVELDEQVVLLNDCILMCSDGLYDMVDDDEILNTVLKNSKKPQKACDSLVELANDNGGRDNISVILLRL